jgi:hypothetical protein
MTHDKRRSPLPAYAAAILPIVFLALPFAASALDPFHPFGDVSIQAIVGNFISAFLGLLGTISLVMFIWGGVLYMTAGGKEDQIKKAKKTFLYSTLGLVIAFGSYAILNVVLNSLIGGALKSS